MDKHSEGVTVMKPANHRDRPQMQAVPRSRPPRSEARSENVLLAALSRDGIKRLQPHLQYVPLELDTSLYAPARPSAHVYFPTSGIVSMLHGMENGAVGEVAVVGNEGALGMAMFTSEKMSRALVKYSGNAYRMRQATLIDEFERGGELRDLLLRYTQALISQIVQTAVCNKHHSVDQQFCRTLLMSRDRLGSNELAATQESIAEMLSVRRVGVSAAASKLQAEGVISYVRGRIVLLNRRELETRVCECYRAVKKEYQRLFGRNGKARGRKSRLWRRQMDGFGKSES